MLSTHRASWVKMLTVVIFAASGISTALAGQKPMRIIPGDIPEHVRPAGLSNPGLKTIDKIGTIDIPSLDLDAISQDDEQEAMNGLPPRYAIPFSVALSPSNSGTWETTADGTRVWRLRISSVNALHINFGFSRFTLPEGAFLFLYSPDGSDAIRPFTYHDNSDVNQLWTPPVRGDQTIIELTVPANVADQVDLELGSINVGYRRFMSLLDPGAADPRSGSCNLDVVCPQAAAWAAQIPAVAVISTGGSRFCTGFAVNNTAQDQTPFFMTAFHCTVTSANAASLVAFWNFQNSTCRAPGSGASGGAGDGSLAQFSTGATFLAANSPSDFTLVRFNAPINPAFNISFAGWDYNGAFPASGACIHHPNTDEKRITFYDVPPLSFHESHSSSWGCSAYPGPGDGTHIRVYWENNPPTFIGVTEPGSSGSPLFDNNHRIIGQLHGGPSACGATNDNLSDCYGRFAMSWPGGGTNTTRLSNWLDPSNSNPGFIDTITGGGLTVSPSGNVLSVGVVGGPFTNPSTVYTIQNSTSNPANYNVSIVGGGTAPVLLNGGAGPLTGTINPGNNVNVTVTYDASANSLPAGTYSTDVKFQDTTNSIQTTRTHTLEIGQTAFTTAPANGLSAGGPVGGPFAATQVYTLTSTRPTPVNITVSADQPWISLNGVAGPLNLNLNGNGANTNVTVGYSAAANSLAAGLYTGTVTITNASGGAGSTTRPVTLEVGRFSYTATDTPKPIADLGTAVSTITVPDSYCIGDVNVDVNITHTFIGDLLITLTSPTGVTVTLHNRTGGGTDDLVGTYDDSGALVPDGPGTLADFNATPVNGVWTLTVADQASGDSGTLNSWALKIASLPGGCPPPPTVIYSFPLDSDPGWSVQGQWQFGQPTGGGSHNLDPTSGFTGTNVYGYNLAGDYPNSLSPTQYLTTTAINCSGLTGTKLRFRRWLGVESATFDHANIQVSNNGTTWTDVWNHVGGAEADASWILQSFNIGAVADGQATVYIRWGMGTTDGSVTYPGWNIDDIQILANVSCAGVLVGDANLDTVRDGKDISAFTGLVLSPGSATQSQKCACDVNTDGNIDTADIDPFVNLLLAP